MDESVKKACSSVDGGSIAVGSFVGVALEELIDQMTVGGNEFDANEARFLRVERGGTVLLNDICDLHCFQRPVWRRLRKAIRRHDENARICPIGWIDRCGDGRLARHRDVCRAASMPQLGEHVAALGMDRTRDALPPRHLLITVDSRPASIPPSTPSNPLRPAANPPPLVAP